MNRPAPAKNGAAQQRAGGATPFPIAALKRQRQCFDTGQLALGQQQSAIEIPAAGGFLRYIDVEITGTTAGNAAAVAFQADAPLNALSFIEFLPPSGDPPIVPHTSYQIALWNKYGAFSNRPPFADVKSMPGFLATAGAGATGGSFYFKIRIPFELDPVSGFGCITNSAANKSYLLNLTITTSAALYSTAPTAAPTVRCVGWMYYWDEPQSQTRQGTQQVPGPLGLGSFSQLRLDTAPITAGDKYIKVNNTGPVMRALGFVLRTAAGARIANTAVTDIPQLWDFIFNTRDRWLISDTVLMQDMATLYGYGLGYAGTSVLTTFPTVDGAQALDNGVRFFPYFQERGQITPDGPRVQFQVTADASLVQIRGTSFGANAATMEILSNLVRPTHATALYPANRF